MLTATHVEIHFIFFVAGIVGNVAGGLGVVAMDGQHVFLVTRQSIWATKIGSIFNVSILINNSTTQSIVMAGLRDAN